MKVMDVINGFQNCSKQTYEHSLRTGNLAMLTAVAMGETKENAELYQTAGFVHDAGKYLCLEEVESTIDLKQLPDREREEFFKHIKSHVTGVNFIRNCEDCKQEYLDAIAYHHNDSLGKGYSIDTELYGNPPLKREEIPYVAKLIHSVDVFEAKTAVRTYQKEPQSISKVKEDLMKEASLGVFENEINTALCLQVTDKWISISLEDQLKPISYESACRILGKEIDLNPEDLSLEEKIMDKLQGIEESIKSMHDQTSNITMRIEALEDTQDRIKDIVEQDIERNKVQENEMEV